MGESAEKEKSLDRKRSEVAFEMQVLGHLMKRYMDGLTEEKKLMHPQKGRGLSGTNLFIIGYLYENRHREVYQKELEEKMNVRRSTISKVLQIMEDKQLIIKKQAEHDGRVKTIRLSEKVLENIAAWQNNMHILENRMMAGFTEEELEQFLYLIHKAKQNFED